jgi:hypothetical protein
VGISLLELEMKEIKDDVLKILHWNGTQAYVEKFLPSTNPNLHAFKQLNLLYFFRVIL